MSDIYYRDRATKYAPKTVDEIVRAAHELARQGHSDHTISAVLKLEINSVRQLLGQRLAP
jgi:hypothetical protein